MSNPVRTHLARLTSLSGAGPTFEVNEAPDGPGELFEEWFEHAITAGVQEPHAVTLSTVQSTGVPDARVLILKDFDKDGRWAFSSSSASAKGKQLTACPVAALTFYWPTLVRSIRIRGRITPASDEESRADFLARSISARATALSGEQSSSLPDPAQLDTEITKAQDLLDQDPNAGADTWRKYWLTADVVEFWQGEETRRHTRLQYQRHDNTWTRQQLRP